MIRLQNLTNRGIRFQGALIDAYGFADFASIIDYTTLAKLTNSGKARYFTVTPKVQPKVELAEVVDIPAKDIPVEVEAEPFAEETVEVQEEVQEETEEVKEVETKTPTTKRGKKRKADSESE